MTGRVVGATGHEFVVWREPFQDQSIYSQAPFWDIDELFEQMPRTLATGDLTPPEPAFP